LWLGISTTFFNSIFDLRIQRRSETEIYGEEQNATLLRKLMSFCRELNPDIKFVVGGSRMYNFSRYGFYVFSGSADNEIVEFTKWCKDSTYKPEIRITIDKQISCKEFNRFTTSKIIWEKNDIILDNQPLPIEISRGCIFKCKFCAFPMNGKTKGEWIKRADVLLEELTYNYENFGTTDYILSDDTYNDSADKLKFLLENVYSKLPFKIKFTSYLRLDLMMRFPETIEILKESGLVSAVFGIETNNFQSAKAIGKGMPFEKQIAFLQDIKSSQFKDILLASGFIFGLPFDTKESINELKEFLLSDDNPLDYWEANALAINPKDKSLHKSYFSEFDLEYDKYNYIIDESDMSNIFTLNWSLPNQLTYKSCVKEASEFNDISREHRRYKYGAFAYHRYCYVIDNANDIMTMSRKDLLKKYNLGKLVSNVNKEYYRRLLSI